jgi:fucose permease
MTATATTAPVGLFVRDRFTWLAYFLVSYYSYMQSSLGPLMPFLRDELSLSYTVGGYHLSAFAVAMILVGTLGDAPTRWWGRQRCVWFGGLGFAGGMLILLAAPHPALTVGGSFVMGIFGSIMLSAANASMVDYHGERRAIPITEANVAASLTASIAPLLIGGFAAVGLGWRVGLLVMIVTWALVALAARSIPIPSPSTAQKPSDSSQAKANRLPPAFWGYWFVILFGVSVEGALIFWGAEYLVGAVGMSNEAASAWMSAFFIAALIGRVGGSVLARRLPSGRLVFIAALVTLFSFPLFWLGQSPVINLIGLFCMGVGVSNLFPLTLAAATTAAASRPDAASARMFIGAGIALLVTPQLLAAIADQVNIQQAFGFVGVLALVVVVTVLAANRLAASQTL